MNYQIMSSFKSIPSVTTNLGMENKFQPSRDTQSIIFFVSNEMKKSVVVPFLVNNEIQIGKRFTTCKLLRKSNENTHYYLLTLTNEESRLLEYQNN
ncbi:hypothetical protein [Carnobacterium maltaromaticum]|uniref:hypothetical protein n=1 Tax=Carnobacterium maltaromaticum TaxID=2751 RepID=UPI00191B9A39|nr:hypothetical protein [Carnobacterium maltaromaticum]CAD5903080.1 hypothetical protein CMALT394_630002 [Carnobacterium maltaromaticum]